MENNIEIAINKLYKELQAYQNMEKMTNSDWDEGFDSGIELCLNLMEKYNIIRNK